jgi:hypothetical protein
MDIVTQDEMEFLRLLLKCDANLNQEKKHLKTKLARKDFSEYVEVSAMKFKLFSVENILSSYKMTIDKEYGQIETNVIHPIFWP